MIISIINYTQMGDDEVQRVIRAINRQLNEEFKLYWNIVAQLRLEGSGRLEPAPENPTAMRGDAVIYLWDQLNVKDALGYHSVNMTGVPVGFVFTELSRELGEDWSVTLSHEALELLVDPQTNGYEIGPHPENPDHTVFYWREVCDAVQTEFYEIDGVSVSNFVLKHYFTVGEESESRNDFLGNHALPSLGINPGGYMGYYDPETDTIEYLEDSQGRERRDIKNKLRGARRGIRYQEKHQSQSESPQNVGIDGNPIFDAFVVEVRGGGDIASLKKLLNKNWAIETVEDSDNEYDLVPLKNYIPSISEIFELHEKLIQFPESTNIDVCYMDPQPGITDADEKDIFLINPSKNVRLSSSSGGSHHSKTTRNTQWSVEQVKADKAWKLPLPPNGKKYGEGIRIGHPDSGYRRHYELDPIHDYRIINDVDWDFVEDDANPKNEDGSHGSGTASVIMSGVGGPEKKYVTGIAPKAELMPLRVAKNKWLAPTPVLFGGGMRRLRKAINHARKNQCHVISISLGGLSENKSLHNAIKKAVDEGIIILAAAGNKWPNVVYPAKFKEVIAVAACNVEKKAWSDSSSGKEVDVTAPGESVWKAGYNNEKEIVIRSSGTSFSVATTAGIAALWLAYWGREQLIAHYGGNKKKMVEEFRKLLKATCDTNHQLPNVGFGTGIVDAEKLLKKKLF